MVRIASQANAHQRTATSEAPENSRKILKTRQKPCLISQRNHRLQRILHKQTFQQLFYRATAENVVQLLTAPNRFFSYVLMCEVVYWWNVMWVAVELFLRSKYLVSSKFRHIETVQKSLSEKVSLGLQKILHRERSFFFPRSHARRDKE